MLLFALHLADDPDPSAVAEALRATARPFHQLDEGTLSTLTSDTGRLVVGTIGHSTERSAPRRYLAERDRMVVAYDGLPLAPDGSFPAWDAAALHDQWSVWGPRLEGQFSALRADLAHDTFECLTDPLGLHPLFAQRLPDGWIVANSVEAIRRIGGQTEADPLGLSSFLTLGWTVDDRTLLRGVRSLPGGCSFEFNQREMRTTRNFTPDVIAQIARSGSPSEDETTGLVDELVALAGTALRDTHLPVKCAITGGRDSRVLLGLCLAAGVTPATATVGDPDDIDVLIGAEIAARAGLPHQVHQPSKNDLYDDVTGVVEAFLSLTDGLSTLLHVADIGDLYQDPTHVGVQAWGVGGEIARGGAGVIGAFAANAPAVHASREFQARLLRAKVRDMAGILTPAAIAESRAYVDRFIADRLEEGWRPGELSEAFFTFERVGRLTSAGVRRSTAVDDVFAPFATRPFVSYAFRLGRAERYLQAAHYRILGKLDPGLRDHRFDLPWLPQRRRRAPLYASVDMARMVAARARLRLGGPPPATGPLAPRRFVFTWLEKHLDQHREMALSNDATSPLWEWVDRAALERTLAAERFDDSTAEGLLRAITLSWYFERARRAHQAGMISRR